MFYVISQPFLKISTGNFVHIFISTYPSNILYGFWRKKYFEGEYFEKEKMLRMLKILGNFQNFQNRR